MKSNYADLLNNLDNMQQAMNLAAYKSVLNSAENTIVKLESLLVAAEQERDQLRQRIEAARKSYIELTNSVEFADNGEAAYIATVSMMDDFDNLFDTLPPIADKEK